MTWDREKEGTDLIRRVRELIQGPSRGSIRSAMFASFTITALLAIALTGMTLYIRFSAQLDGTVEQENQRLVAQVSQSINTYLRDMLRLSDSLYYNVIKSTDLLAEEVEPEVRLLYDTYSDYVEDIALFDSAGRLLASAPAVVVREDVPVAQEDWFIQAMEQTANFHFGRPKVQRLFQEQTPQYPWVISLSSAVELTSGTDTQLGVLLIDLKYSALEDIFRNIKLSESGYVYLMDRDGALIYHPERTLIASGLEAESNLETAERQEGNYVETWEGRERSIIVRDVGYTGWKAVGVVEGSRFSVGSGQDILVVLIIFCIYFELLIILNSALSRKLTDPIRRLRESVIRLQEHPESGDIYIGGTLETQELGSAVQEMVRRTEQLNRDIMREHQQKVKSELTALQAQINPHFLYNTLDIIVWMIENGQKEDAIRVVTALARFFRISLSKGRNVIPVKDELEHVRNYLLIQNMRYKNKFRYTIDCDPAAAELSTIKLVVQPIVENAIYHSMEFMDGDGLIAIRAWTEGGDLLITVSDNGLGMTPDVVERLLSAAPAEERRGGNSRRGSGVGLRNVQERIRLYFGEKYGVHIESEPDEGTVVTLRMAAIPFGEMEDT